LGNHAKSPPKAIFLRQIPSLKIDNLPAFAGFFVDFWLEKARIIE